MKRFGVVLFLLNAVVVSSPLAWAKSSAVENVSNRGIVSSNRQAVAAAAAAETAKVSTSFVDAFAGNDVDEHPVQDEQKPQQHRELQTRSRKRERMERRRERMRRKMERRRRQRRKMRERDYGESRGSRSRSYKSSSGMSGSYGSKSGSSKSRRG